MCLSAAKSWTSDAESKHLSANNTKISGTIPIGSRLQLSTGKYRFHFHAAQSLKPKLTIRKK